MPDSSSAFQAEEDSKTSYEQQEKSTQYSAFQTVRAKQKTEFSISLLPTRSIQFPPTLLFLAFCSLPDLRFQKGFIRFGAEVLASELNMENASIATET